MSLPSTCPHLPAPDQHMTYRCLTESKRASETVFYVEALKYGHYLWLNMHAGRSILAITRALYADVQEKDPVLGQWPLPYAALRWIIASHPSDSFPGNPRISFQHQATRLHGERQNLRRTRAWAVWAIIRKVKPTLSGDQQQAIEEPTIDYIKSRLEAIGHENEVNIWQAALSIKI